MECTPEVLSSSDMVSRPLSIHGQPLPAAIAPLGFSISYEGKPVLQGVEIESLARDYGTPLYVLDGKTIRAKAQGYVGGLKDKYPAESLVLFAAKANLSMGLAKLIQQEGMGIDVVSAGELFTVRQAGFPMDRVLMNGNNKSRQELMMALEYGINRISVDNFSELDLLFDVCQSMDKTANVLLRVAPGIECHTHEYLKTGNNDNKFGFSLPLLSAALDKIQNEYEGRIVLKGLHAHIGSQIFELKAYRDLVQIMLNVYYNIRETYGWTLSDMDIGGGLGIHYTQQDDPPLVVDYIQAITEKMVQYAETIDYPLPRLIIEPGRSMVATAGMTLYTVGARKDIPEGRSFVAVDGGMGDNIRPALYQARYTAAVANKINERPEEEIRLVGKYCESGDVLIPDVRLPKLEPGDSLMVFGTGAYNYTMSSNYNRIPRPAMVLVDHGKAHLLVRRETFDDLIAQDLIPETLLGD